MDRSLTEMAIRGLEVERQRIDDAIRELRSQLEDGSGRQKQQTAPSEPQSQTLPETQLAQTKHRMSPAGRRRIAEANKRRALARKESAAAAKQAAPAPAKKPAAKRSGLTPEGRARLAEAVRQRNIARAAANKKTASK
jgi:hypothetical protein